MRDNIQNTDTKHNVWRFHIYNFQKICTIVQKVNILQKKKKKK